MKEKLVIIGANDFQSQLIRKANSLGYETHVFAWEDGSVGKKFADFFYPISIIEKDKILEVCKKIKPVGVCSIASDLANITVHYLASNLGLVCNSEECIKLSTNKHLMRLAFEKNNNPSPRSFLVDIATDITTLNLSFPIIVKPTDRSGSRGINRIDDTENLLSAIKSACCESFEKKALIEEFVTGQEYSVEYISDHGKHYFLALTEKITTGSPHYIEIAHIQPANVNNKVLDCIKAIIPKALDALQIKFGASHSEIKIDKDNNIKIIEIGSRMGGGCIGSDLVPLSTGYDYMKMVIDSSVGKELDFTVNAHKKYAEIRFLLTQKDVDVLKKITLTDNVYLVRKVILMDTIQNIVVDSSQRYGYYILAHDYIVNNYYNIDKE